MQADTIRLSRSEIARIEASKRWRQERIEVFTLDDGQTKVLVKGQRPRRMAIGYHIVNGLARLFELPWLQAAPAYGGRKAQNIEFCQLQQLQKMALAAPEPLYQGDEYIVMSYLEGREFLVVLRDAAKEGQSEYMRVWEQGLLALQKVHTQGLSLSQAFARNMIWTNSGMAFIDFEDNPLEVMSLPQAQARDYAFYLHSSALWIEDYQRACAVWTRVLQKEPEVLALLQSGAKKLAWLHHLPAHPTRYGRDTWRVQKLGNFLKFLVQ